MPYSMRDGAIQRRNRANHNRSGGIAGIMCPKKLLHLALLCIVVSTCLPAAGQRFELAVTGGAHFPVNADFDTNAGWALQADYAQRLVNARVAAVYVDVPLAFGLRSNGLLPSLAGIEQREFSSWFFAPGFKLKLAPGFPLSPFLTAGAGVAHFNVDATTTSPSRSVNKGVVQFGGGVDVKVAPFLSLRGEVRDYYSGNPFGGIAGLTSSGQHNILPLGGIVLRF